MHMNQIRNSIQGLETGTILQRLVYVVFLILGIFFFVASLSTVYEIYLLVQTSDTVSAQHITLRLLYIALNFIVGYGLVFCRKWVMAFFATNTVLMGGGFLYTQATDLYQSDMASSTFTAFVLSIFVFLVTFLFRKFLYGKLFQRNTYVSYLILLLVTFTISYLI